VVVVAELLPVIMQLLQALEQQAKGLMVLTAEVRAVVVEVPEQQVILLLHQMVVQAAPE
jgi:hypothetical protein